MPDDGYAPYFDVKKYHRDGEIEELELNDDELGKRIFKLTIQLHEWIKQHDITDIENHYNQ